MRQPKVSVKATAVFRCGHTKTVCNITPAQAVTLKRVAKAALCSDCQLEENWKEVERRKKEKP